MSFLSEISTTTAEFIDNYSEYVKYVIVGLGMLAVYVLFKAWKG